MFDFIQKHYIRIAFLMPVVTALTLAATSIIGCDNGSSPLLSSSLTIVDSLARPAIAEGLVISDTGFAAWNAATPSAETATTAAILEESKSLQAIHNALGLNGALSQARIDSVVAAFIPDVMRINTAIASGYVNQVVTFESTGNLGGAYTGGIARPVSGRRLEDDAIDITLTVLTDIPTGGALGTASFNSDSVPYRPDLPGLWNNGPGDTANLRVGHHLLFNQTSSGAVNASFPYLAMPN